MKNLKRLGAAVALTLALGVSAFAGEIQTPPSAPPAPGIMETPPCSGGQAAPDPAVPGQIETPPAANASGYSVAEMAINLLESLLFF